MTGGSYDPYAYRPAPRGGRSPVVVAVAVVAVVALLLLLGAVVFFWALLAFGGPIG